MDEHGKTTRVSLIHPNYFNQALAYAEVENIVAKDGPDGTITVDTDGLSHDEIVEALMNGLALAYTKSVVADSRT